MKNTNCVALDLTVSNDFDGRTAVRKVSDNLTSINCFLPAGKNEDGSYKKCANFNVRQTSKTEIDDEIKCGDHITVKGFFATESYTNKEGKEVASVYIVAREISHIAYEPTSATDEDFIDIDKALESEEVSFK